MGLETVEQPRNSVAPSAAGRANGRGEQALPDPPANIHMVDQLLDASGLCPSDLAPPQKP